MLTCKSKHKYLKNYPNRTIRERLVDILKFWKKLVTWRRKSINKEHNDVQHSYYPSVHYKCSSHAENGKYTLSPPRHICIWGMHFPLTHMTSRNIHTNEHKWWILSNCVREGLKKIKNGWIYPTLIWPQPARQSVG